MRSYLRAKAPSYVLLATRKFEGATVGDLGRTAAAKSITFASGAENWTLVNGTANFLAADPDGCFIDAAGFKFQSGSSACSDDWADGNVLGPCLYKLVSEIVPSGLWSASTLGLLSMYAWLDFVWIVDASSANAGNEFLSCGIGSTSAFANGGCGRVGFGSAAGAGSGIQRSTFNSLNATSALIGIPGSVIPSAIRNRVTPGSIEIAFGIASGLTPPTAWYSKDAISILAGDNTPNVAGGHYNATAMVAAIGLVDSNGGGAFVGNVKALYIYGQKLVTGQSLTVAA